MNRPHPETLEVNQSALERRMVRGMKYSSTCWDESSPQILFSDSTACRDGVLVLSAPGYHRYCIPRAYLVPHDGLLDGGEVLERGEQDMAPLRTADIVDKAPELLAQGNEDLVLILDGLCSRAVLAMDGRARDIGRGRRGRQADRQGRESAPRGCARRPKQGQWSRGGGWH